eukprot:Pgem_evm2s10330
MSSYCMSKRFKLSEREIIFCLKDDESQIVVNFSMIDSPVLTDFLKNYDKDYVSYEEAMCLKLSDGDLLDYIKTLKKFHDDKYNCNLLTLQKLTSICQRVKCWHDELQLEGDWTLHYIVELFQLNQHCNGGSNNDMKDYKDALAKYAAFFSIKLIQCGLSYGMVIGMFENTQRGFNFKDYLIEMIDILYKQNAVDPAVVGYFFNFYQLTQY